MLLLLLRGSDIVYGYNCLLLLLLDDAKIDDHNLRRRELDGQKDALFMMKRRVAAEKQPPTIAAPH